jgi:hypothetical protein
MILQRKHFLLRLFCVPGFSCILVQRLFLCRGSMWNFTFIYIYIYIYVLLSFPKVGYNVASNFGNTPATVPESVVIPCWLVICLSNGYRLHLRLTVNSTI